MLLGCVLLMAACRTPKPVSYPSEGAVYPKPIDEPSKNLPPDLFRDMPVFPGAKVEHVRKPTHSMREILFSTDAQLDEVAAYYKEQLKKNNFQITSTLLVRAHHSWSCSFYTDGRPGDIRLYPSEQGKSRLAIALMYVLPDKPNDPYIEPKEVFDAVGPGEAMQAPSPTSEKSSMR